MINDCAWKTCDSFSILIFPFTTMFSVMHFDFLIDHHTSEDESGYPVLCVCHQRRYTVFWVGQLWKLIWSEYIAFLKHGIYQPWFFDVESWSLELKYHAQKSHTGRHYGQAWIAGFVTFHSLSVCVGVCKHANTLVCLCTRALYEMLCYELRSVNLQLFYLSLFNHCYTLGNQLQWL